MTVGDAIMFIDNDFTPTENIEYWERVLGIRPDCLH